MTKADSRSLAAFTIGKRHGKKELAEAISKELYALRDKSHPEGHDKRSMYFCILMSIRALVEKETA